MTGFGKRPRNKIYIVSKRRSIPGDKTSGAVKAYEKLLKREKIEGKTPWMIDALKKAKAKLTKMGIAKT